ncbi:ATP-binding protein [Kurthia zopfii]|uniref:DNA helicase HerA-like ATPase n=1 Tax=Kurthia zopfii TaxID=1650 RepID=A0A8B4QCR1_9BACL|nr:ATP-binding protein [Kurthia zopfii]PWI21349.1 ATP-binding protein [Kurthia zopfii]TDR34349.1 DNA helicase HerA-like ATPase [Kurthia zopfii]GEK31851.1 ATP-binding protein [Kurthia zopfii]STX10541.1 Type IV secretory pathway, VirB4 components [Kurthia zopfii]
MNELMQLSEKVEPAIQSSVQLLGKSYLSNLANYNVAPKIESELMTESELARQIRLFEITKIVYDKTEDITERLVNVYNTLGSLNNSLILIIDSDGSEIKFYLGTRSYQISIAQESLLKSMKGNFPGTKLTKITNGGSTDLINSVITGRKSRLRRTVASVSGIPAFKDTDKETFVQGLEKFINAMHGEKFSTILLADALTSDQSLVIKQGYENMYSTLSKFQKIDYTAGKNESQALTESLSEGITESINDSIGQTQSYTNTSTHGTNESKSKGSSSGGVLAPFGIGINKGKNTNKTEGINRSNSFAESNGSTSTIGSSSATSKNISNNTTNTEGTSQTVQVHVEDKRVTELLDKIDLHLDRLNSAADLGLWQFAAYFLADDEQTATVAAANYQAIIRGNESAIEGTAINIWNSEHINNVPVRESLKQLQHPKFQINEFGLGSTTPSSLINTRELAIAFGLPRKSINGLPVVEMAEFGRNVTYLSKFSNEKSVEIGNVYHMGEIEETKVDLDVKSLAMHTFITGSTGSGKSNTVYKLLESLLKQKVKFLVIEPAKGEYKHVFGGYEDVNVFGTNPKQTEVLRINPFYFQPEIHVLEHIERLIEIFNACWPMYAAMPAILKEAVEEVYRKTGWQLESSLNFNSNPQYPTMKLLAEVLPNIIEKSSYSEEVKSNYVGSLVTRINSLTTGILSNVFVDNEIDNKLLFDENCIVDLSQIGSAETKSIVMGILFMRLQEYRIASSTTMNIPLKHVTVLEEAHHLLRRTSGTQSDEGANMQGKSVEMITNGIAEMRTYGEGFIIVDQSPNLLDPSAIRNTNTKIILRLPDESDRILVGGAAALNNLQYNEITKLETGVAVIYQNNWLEAVLCKVHMFDNEKPYRYNFDMVSHIKEGRERFAEIVTGLLTKEYDTEDMITKIQMNNKLNTILKQQIISEVNDNANLTILKQGNEVLLGEFFASYIPLPEVIAFSNNAYSIQDFNKKFQKAIAMYVGHLECNDLIQECLMIYYCKLNSSFVKYYLEWFEDKKEGVII